MNDPFSAHQSLKAEISEGALGFWSAAASTRRQKAQWVFELGQEPHWVDFLVCFYPGIFLGVIAGVLLVPDASVFIYLVVSILSASFTE